MIGEAFPIGSRHHFNYIVCCTCKNRSVLLDYKAIKQVVLTLCLLKSHSGVQVMCFMLCRLLKPHIASSVVATDDIEIVLLVVKYVHHGRSLESRCGRHITAHSVVT